MSKMDNLRAMREARYDRAAARAKDAAGTTPTQHSDDQYSTTYNEL